MADEEVEIELCCEGLQQAIDDGAVLVVPHENGYVEGVLCEDGKSVMQINFCPFCGSARGGNGVD